MTDRSLRGEAAFAVPGDIDTRTGGYLYDRRLIATLPKLGQPIRHIELMTSWPDPTRDAQDDAVVKLGALPEGMPAIIDGLVFGAIDTERLAGLRRLLIAMLHHPLGLEAGLPAARAAALLAREQANLAHADHVVVSSAHSKQILIDRFDVPADRISVALPGFDRPEVRPGPRGKRNPPLILSVGIVCERKGHDVLIGALAEIADLDWQAAIVGLIQDADVHDALLRLIDQHDLEGRVRITGGLGQAELDGLYREAHVFALATRYEGYGMALSEAQLHGLPIVSCTVGAVPQTAPPQTAILVPPDDPGAFAAALRSLLEDPARHDDLARGSAAKGHALPRWEDTAAVMRDAIDRVRAKAV